MWPLFWNKRKIHFTQEVYCKKAEMSTLNLASQVLQSHERLLRKFVTYNKLALVQWSQKKSISLHQQGIFPYRNLFLPVDFKTKALYKLYYNIYIIFYFFNSRNYKLLWVVIRYSQNINELQLNQKCFLNSPRTIGLALQFKNFVIHCAFLLHLIRSTLKYL